MEEKKVYKLLKDLPDCRKGANIKWDDKMFCYYYEKNGFIMGTTIRGNNYLTKDQVEKSPDFFELVTPKRIEVSIIGMHDRFCGNKPDAYWYQLSVNAPLDKIKLQQIKQAVENTLNNYMPIPLPSKIMDAKPYGNHFVYDKLYTPKQLLEAEERAFNAAREQIPSGPSLATGRLVPASYEYKTFSDYKNETTKHE